MARYRRNALPERAQKFAAYKSKDEPTEYFVMIKLDGSEPMDVVIGEDGREYEKTDHITFDLDTMPKPVRDELTEATLEMVRNILRQLGGRELLDAKTERRKSLENG